MNVPSTFLQLNHSVCVITGGSSGIGQELIRVLKQNNPKIHIINLSRMSLDKSLGGSHMMHIPCDLADLSALESVLGQVQSLVDATSGRILLINNAGFGVYAPFEKSALQGQLEMIAVNITAMVSLTHALLGKIAQRGGGIINLSSAAAFKPIVSFATYGATKSFELYWSLALADELAAKNVTVLAICPQRVNSNFFKRADPEGKRVPIAPPLSSNNVAREILRALAKGSQLLAFSKMDALRCALMIPSRALERLRKTTLFRSDRR